jgi:hypothetical protein
MKYFCPQDFEKDYFEAMNILEKQKDSQKENYNNENICEKNNKDKYCHEFKVLKENEKLNNKIKLLNGKHKKKSSIFEVIEYPYIENNKNHLRKNSKLNSDLTNINSETLLLMEYNGNYISDSHQGNFSNFDAKKVYNKNLSINRDNTKQNEIKKSLEQNININEKSSNDSSIINNDYNFSFISSLFESKHNDKIHSTNFQQLNNRLKPIELKQNLPKKIKKANSYICKKNNLISKKKTYNQRNYSNLFNKNRYSRDTIYTSDFNNKSGTLNQTLKNLTQVKKIYEVPMMKKFKKYNKNITINKFNNKTINNNNKNQKNKLKTVYRNNNFINKSYERFEFKKNINKSMTNKNSKKKQSENKVISQNNKRKNTKITSKNKKRKYLNNIPINKNTNINLFIITNTTKNIFEETSKLFSIKRNSKITTNLTEI